MVRQLHRADLQDVVESELLFHKGGKLTWGEEDYQKAIIEDDKQAIVAAKKGKAVGVLVYSRPSDLLCYDIHRVVANPNFEKKNLKERKDLVKHVVGLARDSSNRRFVRAHVHGDDIETMKLFEKAKWARKRLGGANDEYLYSFAL